MSKIEKIQRQSNNIFIGELEDTMLEIEYNGITQRSPILGVFTVSKKYYVVLLVQEKNAKTTVIYRVEKGDNKEYLQIIEDRSEWATVSTTWNNILDKVK